MCVQIHEGVSDYVKKLSFTEEQNHLLPYGLNAWVLHRSRKLYFLACSSIP